jgi:CheY-like chemotaxis protein
MTAAQRPQQRILIVDDCFATREVLTLVLTVEGYEIACAGDGLEALGHLRSDRPPDLVVLDLMMPHMSGYELLELRKEDERMASIPIIILSAVCDRPADALSLGAAACITKPIGEESLIDQVITTVKSILAPHSGSYEVGDRP